MAKKSFYLNASELDAYQLIVLNKSITRSMVVTGCAGSGKSVLALHKAKEISSQGRSFLYIVFTQALGSYMRAGIRQLGLDVNSFSTYGKCFAPDKDDLGNVIGWHWAKGNFDYIIVDEAQDFSMEAIDVLKSHCNKIFLYGDTAQSLYDKFFFDKNPTVDMDQLEARLKSWESPHARMDELIINHRLPKTIARVAQSLNDDDDQFVPRCQNEGTKKPKILRFPTLENQLAKVYEIITTFSLEDVGILLYRREAVKKAGEFLREKGLTVDVFLDDKYNINYDSNNPKIMTFKSAKGLQFETVFVLDCGSDLGIGESKDLYVAMTRSYDDLYMMYSGQITDLLADVPENLYQTTIGSSVSVGRL